MKNLTALLFDSLGSKSAEERAKSEIHPAKQNNKQRTTSIDIRQSLGLGLGRTL
jgi:hypothetical protein